MPAAAAPMSYSGTSIVVPIVISILLALVLLYLPRRKLKSKTQILHNNIVKERKIIYEGLFKISGRTGFLFLTDSTLEFYYYRKKNNFYVLLKDILSVSLAGDFFFGYKLTIKTTQDEIVFYPDKAKLLKEYIEKNIH